METKHTPGPWKVYTDDGSIGSIVAADDTPIGQAFQVHNLRVDETQEERKANARLMAAAPALLASLQDLVDCERTTAAMWRQARIAIAKAITPAAQESEP